MHAYVLIGLTDCDEQLIVEKLTKHKQIEEIHILFGEWDLIAKLNVESPEEAGTFVMDKIRSLNEVQLTSTLIVAR